MARMSADTVARLRLAVADPAALVSRVRRPVRSD